MITRPDGLNFIHISTIVSRLQNLFQLFSVGPDSNKRFDSQCSSASLTGLRRWCCSDSWAAFQYSQQLWVQRLPFLAVFFFIFWGKNPRSQQYESVLSCYILLFTQRIEKVIHRNKAIHNLLRPSMQASCKVPTFPTKEDHAWPVLHTAVHKILAAHLAMLLCLYRGFSKNSQHPLLCLLKMLFCPIVQLAL